MQKEQQIAIEINDFFKKIVEKKDNKNLKNFFEFIKRMHKHAPFNDALVFIQNPDCFYYATAPQWKNIFNRKIKNNSRPLVTLIPFGPVNFVYDYNDTTGDGNSPSFQEQINWMKEKELYFDKRIIQKTIKNINTIKINVIYNKDIFEYIKNNSSKTMGYATTSVINREIVLHPRYSEDKYILESYGVLCHEIAHHLLGHLGEFKIKKRKKEKIIAKDKRYLGGHLMELEAELTAWIVFLMHGIEKNSIDYIATYILNEENFNEISISEVLKISKKIYDFGIKKVNL